jgi:hypothetical protein
MKTLKQASLFALVLIAVGVLFHTVGSKKVSAQRTATRRVVFASVQVYTPRNHGKHTKRGRMALNPSGYTSGTAGTAADSGKTWTIAAGVDANGNRYLTNGLTGGSLRYAFYAGSVSAWLISSALNNETLGTFEYQGPSSGVAGTFSLTGWNAGPGTTGTAPAPTFTANAATATVKSRITTCLY